MTSPPTLLPAIAKLKGGDDVIDLRLPDSTTGLSGLGAVTGVAAGCCAIVNDAIEASSVIAPNIDVVLVFIAILLVRNSYSLRVNFT